MAFYPTSEVKITEFNQHNFVWFPVNRTENSQALDLGAQFLKIYFALKISVDFFFIENTTEILLNITCWKLF